MLERLQSLNKLQVWPLDRYCLSVRVYSFNSEQRHKSSLISTAHEYFMFLIKLKKTLAFHHQ